jgi:hypothetical protein
MAIFLSNQFVRSLNVQFAFSTYESGSTILFIHNGDEDSYFLAALDEKGQLEIEDQRGNGTNWKADLGK